MGAVKRTCVVIPHRNLRINCTLGLSHAAVCGMGRIGRAMMEKAWDASLNLKRIFADVDKASRWNSKPGICLMCCEIETRSPDQICAICKVIERARERVMRGDVEALVFYKGGKFRVGRTRPTVGALSSAYAGV
ncbi:MAG: hypothetical protein HZA15_15575 [Nitrospirae bacterium]|nr:hypothetical protein [Nitrospirota bacterium]